MNECRYVEAGNEVRKGGDVSIKEIRKFMYQHVASCVLSIENSCGFDSHNVDI